MSRLTLAIRLTLFLPPVWIAMAVTAVALVGNGWEPGLDIIDYAVTRLLH